MVVHFDSGKFYITPVSGRHTVCLCGQWLQDNYAKDAGRKTSDWKKVTCKRCLKKKPQNFT